MGVIQATAAVVDVTKQKTAALLRDGCFVYGFKELSSPVQSNV
ncbi:hypothetical protein B4107_3661 [Bacillus safensis]|nr:hypothetical protein B4107_3661 [Bacillus safensis]